MAFDPAPREAGGLSEVQPVKRAKADWCYEVPSGADFILTGTARRSVDKSSLHLWWLILRENNSEVAAARPLSVPASQPPVGLLCCSSSAPASRSTEHEKQ